MKKLIALFLLLPLVGYALKTLPTYNFDKPHIPTKPHFYLVCPKGFCEDKQKEDSPIFSVSRDQLEQAWQEVAKTLPRTHELNYDKHLHQYLYVQRSPMLHFPDYIFVRFVDLGKDKSSVMFFSTSRYGYYDFRVNKVRVKEWLGLLERKVKS